MVCALRIRVFQNLLFILLLPFRNRFYLYIKCIETYIHADPFIDLSSALYNNDAVNLANVINKYLSIHFRHNLIVTCKLINCLFKNTN